MRKLFERNSFVCSKFNHARFAFIALICTFAGSAIASPAVTLVPHRAVYEMTLEEVRPGSAVSSILGYMSFEFSGSSCDGFTLNMSVVNSITNLGGDTALVDLRSTSWEQADGNKFRFNSTQYQNRQLVDVTTGNASRASASGTVSVKLEKPDETEIKLKGDVLFPTQHSLLLLNAAHDGKNFVYADVYDGSEKGDKVYSTTTFIGRALSPGADAVFPVVENAARLLEMKSWPVEISYFETDKKGEVLPSYELSFRLYGNGVSRHLVIDYGDYALRGELSNIEFLETDSCVLKKNNG